MRTATEQAPAGSALPPLQVKVFGPDCAPLTPAELRRLFKGRRLTPARRDRLAQSGRVVAMCGTRTVGMAAYDRADGELRVHEFAIDPSAACPEDHVVNAVLDALEVACLAGGGRRLVLLPRAVVASSLLRRRGFVTIAEGCAGSWFEKTFES